MRSKIKNIKEASEEILGAIKNKERIILYGDSDLDGVSSVIILKESIESFGGSADVILANREKRGYGLSTELISSIEKDAPALLISLDCGISNFEGAKAAKNVGFRLIIIDHHEPHTKLPEADIIVDPKQENDNYPFKDMANAGVTLSLVKEMLGGKFTLFRRSFVEIVALATVADMVLRKEDNKKILEEGLPYLENPQIPALRALKKTVKENFVQKAVSLLNITKTRGEVNQCFLFLSAKSEKEAEKMMEDLYRAYEERKSEIVSAVKSVEKEISSEDKVIFCEGKFSHYLSGSVASRIINKHKKPTFLYKKGEKTSRGSVRMPSGMNAVKAMHHCRKHLVAFGGHPPAAGFTVDNRNIEDFKKCLIDYFEKYEKNNHIQ